MELSKKSEIREFKSTPLRTEIPPDYFRVPCTDISDVQLKGNEYIVRDAAGRQVKGFHKAIYGELCGNGSDFLVFKKGSSFQIYDSMGRNRVDRSGLLVGEFRGVSGQYITFEKGGSVYTYDKSFRQIGMPRLKNY
jgi:hypothetical protein